MEEYICPICGEVMERQYNNENDCLMLNCCGEEYSEDEFEMCQETKQPKNKKFFL